MNAKSEVLMDIWTKFKENNIEIPLPQRELKII
jgi:small-conductance mechanosensitive channel